MKLPAPAKVNLHLRVVGKREDGFHEIETLIAPLSLADEITVEIGRGEGVEVVCDDPRVPVGAENLAARAAAIFMRETGRKFSARIAISKRIPMGAGLGGGSSDGASVLLALDRILEAGLGFERLGSMAAELGSDVPVFLRGGAAVCRGRGEIIEPYAIPERLPLLLLKPEFGVETPWAYKTWARSRGLPGEDEAEQDLGWTKVFNDLERPVFEKFLLLPVIKKWLREQPETHSAAMSGSGSTMFAILHDEAGGPALEARAKAFFGEGLWTAQCQVPAA